MRKRIAAALAAAATASLAAGIVAPAQADVAGPAQGQSKIAGSDRYSTAIAVSQKTFKPSSDGTGVPAVVLATGDNWPDGLSGAAIAGNLNGPLLLTPSDQLRWDVAAELKRLNPMAVIIAGSSAVVSANVEAQVKYNLPNAEIVRDFGSDRFDTAAKLSADLYSGGAQTIYISSGLNFADAVGASSPAALSAGPLLLAAPDSLPASTYSELVRLKNLGQVENVIVLGGTSAIGDSVFQKINSIFGKGADGYDKTVRVSGPDRYTTTSRLVDILWDPKTSTPAKTAYYVDGDAWPDALSAGAAAAAQDAPVLLTAKACMPWATKDWDNRNNGTLTSRIWIGNNAAQTTNGC